MLDKEKVWLGELSVPTWPYLLTGMLKNKPNQTQLRLFEEKVILMDHKSL